MTKTTTDVATSRPPARWPAMLVVVAVVGGVVGLGMAVTTALRQPKVVGTVGRSGDLTLNVARGQWVAHEVGEMPGMPMTGMPPEGFRRLHLEVSMSNGSARAHSFGPHQFRLESSTQRWPLENSSFVTGALGPGQAMAGDLFFDVPAKATDAPLRLAWLPPGRDVVFRLDGALGGGPDAGGHGGKGDGT